jgi:hypothetical protein
VHHLKQVGNQHNRKIRHFRNWQAYADALIHTPRENNLLLDKEYLRGGFSDSRVMAVAGHAQMRDRILIPGSIGLPA